LFGPSTCTDIHRHGPAQIIAGDETRQPRMEWNDVVELQVDLDKGLPVLLALGDRHPVEDVPGHVELPVDTPAGQVPRDIAPSGEQQAIPVRKRRLEQVAAGVVGEMRRTKKRTLHVVGPAVQGAHKIPGVAFALDDNCLAVPAGVGHQLDAVGVVHQHLAVVGPFQRVVVARVRHHDVCPHTPGIGEQELLSSNALVEVPGDRQREVAGAS
jgi:hypothetical protein